MLKNVYSIVTETPMTNSNTENLANVLTGNGILKIQDITQSAGLTIADITGKCILKQQLFASENYSFNLPKGVYIVQLSAQSNQQSMKVIL
jgi:hypothetical protein